MSNDIQEWTGSELARRLVFLKTIADLVDTELKTLKSAAMEKFDKGMSIPARAEDDVKLGQVLRTDPKPVPVIVDGEALDEYAFAHYPNEVGAHLTLGDPAEIVPILMEAGRADLFSQERFVPDYLIRQLEAEALSGKKIPGIEVRTPGGWMQVKVEHTAKAAVRELLSSMHLLELEEGK